MTVDFSPEARRKALWSTDAAAALGFSKYKTPVQLWLEKRGETIPEDVGEIFAVRMGLAMQGPLAAMHKEDTGDILNPLATVEHATTVFDTPFSAHYDEYNVTRKALHEIKCFGDMRRKDFGEPGSDEVPDEVLAQALHQQGVWIRCAPHLPIIGTEVNVSFGNRARLLFFVPLDLDAVNSVFKNLAGFWKMVKDGVTPPARSVEDALALFPKSLKGTQIMATPEIEAVCTKLSALRVTAKTLEEEIDAAKAEVMMFMRTNDDLTSENNALLGKDGKPLVTWRTSAGAVKIDSKLLRAEMPAIAQQYSVAGEPVRRFLLKGKG